MIKINNSLKIKRIIRAFLAFVITLELILITIELSEYFLKIVIEGISTSTWKSENSIFVRLFNFLKVGVDSVIKEWVVTLCVPLATYFLLRDRDRDILYGEEQLHDVTEAVKEGIIEGVEESNHSIKNYNSVSDNNNNDSKEINQDLKKEQEIEKEQNSQNDEDDFFATFG